MRLDLRLCTPRAAYDVELRVDPDTDVDAVTQALSAAIGHQGSGFLPLYRGRERLGDDGSQE